MRDAITHPEDNRFADVISLWDCAMTLNWDGGVTYLLDPREESLHVALFTLVEATESALLTLAPGTRLVRWTTST